MAFHHWPQSRCECEKWNCQLFCNFLLLAHRAKTAPSHSGWSTSSLISSSQSWVLNSAIASIYCPHMPTQTIAQENLWGKKLSTDLGLRPHDCCCFLPSIAKTNQNKSKGMPGKSLHITWILERYRGLKGLLQLFIAVNKRLLAWQAKAMQCLKNMSKLMKRQWKPKPLHPWWWVHHPHQAPSWIHRPDCCECPTLQMPSSCVSMPAFSLCVHVQKKTVLRNQRCRARLLITLGNIFAGSFVATHMPTHEKQTTNQVYKHTRAHTHMHIFNYNIDTNTHRCTHLQA